MTSIFTARTTSPWAVRGIASLSALMVFLDGVALVVRQLTSAAVQRSPGTGFGAGSAVNQTIRQFGATFGVLTTLGALAPPRATAAAKPGAQTLALGAEA